VRTPENFMGEVSEMLQLEGVLQSADEVMEALADGAVLKAMHPYYSEVHWVKRVGDAVVERVVDSATGEILPSASFRPHFYALLVDNAIETGWLFCVVGEDIDVTRLFGGEQE
jgi:hypothetical protein